MLFKCFVLCYLSIKNTLNIVTIRGKLKKKNFRKYVLRLRTLFRNSSLSFSLTKKANKLPLLIFFFRKEVKREREYRSVKVDTPTHTGGVSKEARR